MLRQGFSCGRRMAKADLAKPVCHRRDQLDGKKMGVCETLGYSVQSNWETTNFDLTICRCSGYTMSNVSSDSRPFQLVTTIPARGRYGFYLHVYGDPAAVIYQVQTRGGMIRTQESQFFLPCRVLMQNNVLRQTPLKLFERLESTQDTLW